MNTHTRMKTCATNRIIMVLMRYLDLNKYIITIKWCPPAQELLFYGKPGSPVKCLVFQKSIVCTVLHRTSCNIVFVKHKKILRLSVVLGTDIMKMLKLLISFSICCLFNLFRLIFYLISQRFSVNSYRKSYTNLEKTRVIFSIFSLFFSNSRV